MLKHLAHYNVLQTDWFIVIAHLCDWQETHKISFPWVQLFSTQYLLAKQNKYAKSSKSIEKDRQVPNYTGRHITGRAAAEMVQNQCWTFQCSLISLCYVWCGCIVIPQELCQMKVVKTTLRSKWQLMYSSSRVNTWEFCLESAHVSASRGTLFSPCQNQMSTSALISKDYLFSNLDQF